MTLYSVPSLILLMCVVAEVYIVKIYLQSWCVFGVVFLFFFREFVCRRLTALLLVVLFLRRESKLKWGAGPSYIIRSGDGVGGYRQGVVAFLIGCINNL